MQTVFLGLLYLEEECNTFVGNIGHHSPTSQKKKKTLILSNIALRISSVINSNACPLRECNVLRMEFTFLFLLRYSILVLSYVGCLSNCYELRVCIVCSRGVVACRLPVAVKLPVFNSQKNSPHKRCNPSDILLTSLLSVFIG
jgi:hypothetical protein